MVFILIIVSKYSIKREMHYIRNCALSHAPSSAVVVKTLAELMGTHSVW